MLGNKVKKLRKNKKMTQQDLANIIGLSQSTIGMIEGNKQGASRDTLVKLADILDTTIDYLLSDNEEPSNEFKPTLSMKEQEKLDKEAQDTINVLSLSLSKNKEYLEPQDYELLQAGIKTLLETMTIKNKEKYTPKKYKNKKQK